MTILNDNDIALAGEYALGLLDTTGEAAANARIATDAEFAAEVEAWRRRLQSMLDGADETPPAHIWNAIKTALPVPSGQDLGNGKLTFWRAVSGISASAAAILGILLLQKPDAIPVPTPEAPLIAALGSESGSTSLTATYDKASGRMIITPVSLKTGDLYPELWVVAADGKPRSLGMVENESATSIIIPAETRQYLSEGGTLAITPEIKGGSASGQPTGPIIASGKIATI